MTCLALFRQTHANPRTTRSLHTPHTEAFLLSSTMAPVSTRGIKSFDFYRKVPLDLTEATWHGGLVSILAM